MAQSALTQWGEFLTDKNQEIPDAGELKSIEAGEGEFVSLIRADIKDGRAVKRTVSIPKWMAIMMESDRIWFKFVESVAGCIKREVEYWINSNY